MESSNTDRGNSPVAGSAAASDEGMLHAVKSLWDELRGLAHDQLTLLAFETKLAGKSLVTMIAAGVMVALLVVTAWLGLMGAAVLWLISIGVVASISMLLVVGANLMFALIPYYLIRRRLRYLQFPATLRSLRPLPLNIPTSQEP